jgi:phosphoserine phosphatase
LKKKQVDVVLLSSSPDFLVELVARALGGLEYQATEYLCTSKGLFSSVGTVMSGGQKAATAEEYRKKGMGYIFAFTDSLQDRPLLEVVDEVVAVFPQKDLQKMAIKRGWRVVQG